MNLSNIKIASRTSELAICQTELIRQALLSLGYTSSVLQVESTGDLRLNQPIYKLGVIGVFTKELDTILLNDKADMAMHSLKDVPTNLANGLTICGVLKRDSPFDTLIYKNKKNIFNHLAHKQVRIATSSLRRKSQWLAKYPHHHIVCIRGNIQTRLKKFNEDDNLDGLILAEAGLQRLNLTFQNAVPLHWMIPAPAQGIIAVACKNDHTKMIEVGQKINHQDTFIVAHIERDFMNALNGGCSVPIACYAKIIKEEVFFVGVIYSFDGTKNIKIQKTAPKKNFADIGKQCAQELLQQENTLTLLSEIKQLK